MREQVPALSNNSNNHHARAAGIRKNELILKFSLMNRAKKNTGPHGPEMQNLTG